MQLPAQLQLPTRTCWGRSGPALPVARRGARSLFGIAPGGACLARDVTTSAVRSYRTVSPLPPRWYRLPDPSKRRSVFCGAFRRVTPPGRYPAPLPLGVRTFLAPLQARGHPALRAGLALRLHSRCVNPHLKFKQRPQQQRQHLQQPVAKDGHPHIQPSRVPAVRCQICESAAAPTR